MPTISAGRFVSVSSGSAGGFSPNTTGSCLRKMISPIAASIPWTTAVGKKSESAPTRNSPKPTCTSPATQPTAITIR